MFDHINRYNREEGEFKQPLQQSTPRISIGSRVRPAPHQAEFLCSALSRWGWQETTAAAHHKMQFSYF